MFVLHADFLRVFLVYIKVVVIAFHNESTQMAY